MKKSLRPDLNEATVYLSTVNKLECVEVHECFTYSFQMTKKRFFR